MKNKRFFNIVVLCLVLLAGVYLPADMQGSVNAAVPKMAGVQTQSAQVIVSDPVIPGLTVAVRDLPPQSIELGTGQEVNPRRLYDRQPAGPSEPASHPDPLLGLQEAVIPGSPQDIDIPILNYDGQGYTGVNPPDTVGDVGASHYIQLVNSGGGTSVAIYDKTGSLVDGPFNLDSLATSGACTSGLGDPIVLYDRQADRWLLSEFASSGNHLCVYISTTPDPLGTYYFYDFITPNFPDYPKYAVWQDAYYVSTNESSPAAYALDRLNMLAGLPATSQRFTGTVLPGFPFQAFTPSDIDSALEPPVGSPNYFMRHRDTEVHGPGGMPDADILEIWEYHVDFDTPANSTFTGPFNIIVSEFDSDLCGLSSFFCFPQPGTSVTLDPLREVIMWRLQYRNFGTHESLVGNFVTDIDGTDHGGVRWFELRKTGAGAWTLFQEGTFAPDIHHRWMGAISMDGSGNIALGYNVSSSTVYPSLHYVGRLRSDPPGTMPQGEYILVSGSASNASNRYGDYSAMSVDPVDDCTFWFTGEYNAASTWSTRIGVFRFDSCTGGMGPDFELSVDPQTQAICAPESASYDIGVASHFGFADPVSFSAQITPTTPMTNTFSVNPLIPPGDSTLTIGDTGAASQGRYTVRITGEAPTVTHLITASLDVYAGAALAPVLLSPANAAGDQAQRPTFTWEAAVMPSTYEIQIALDEGFTQIVDSANGLTEPVYSPALPLDTATQYYWRVRVHDLCGDGAFSQPFTFSTIVMAYDCPVGYTPHMVYQQDFEDGTDGWTHAGTGDTWDLSTDRSNSGAWSMHAVNPASVSDQRLTSPVIDLPQSLLPLTLQFWNYQRIEDSATGCYDGGLLEVSIDGGITWVQVPSTDLLTDPYDGPIATGGGNPLSGKGAWCGDPQDWLNSVVILDAYAGEAAQFRFRLGSDNSVGKEGWYIDDVAVQSCISETYTVTLSAYSTLVVPPGGTAVHEFNLTNIGLSDSYDLEISGDEWPTSILITSPVGLAAGASITIPIQVEVPESFGEAIIANDQFTLTVTSQNNPGLVLNAWGGTNAVVDVGVAATANPLMRSGLPGSEVTFTLQITNTGEYTDTIGLFPIEFPVGWGIHMDMETTPPLSPGESIHADFSVFISEEAEIGQSYTVTMNVFSNLDGENASQAVEVTILVDLERLYLPLISSE